jgi:hypothetical protein
MAKETKPGAASKEVQESLKKITQDEMTLARVIREVSNVKDFQKMLIWIKVEDQVVILGGVATADFKEKAAAAAIKSALRVDNGIATTLPPKRQICWCPNDHSARDCDDSITCDQCCDRKAKPVRNGKKH